MCIRRKGREGLVMYRYILMYLDGKRGLFQLESASGGLCPCSCVT
jgi:hypothetical protein